MEKFRAVCRSNGYPCGWEKMGLNNMSLMSASAVSGNVSEEMSPAISASNHLMGRQISAKWMYWSIPGLDRRNESVALGRQKKKKKVKGKEKNRLQTRKDKNKPFTIRSATQHGCDVCGLSADTDRNFNYFIREGKWKDLSVVISAVFHRSI